MKISQQIISIKNTLLLAILLTCIGYNTAQAAGGDDEDVSVPIRLKRQEVRDVTIKNKDHQDLMLKSFSGNGNPTVVVFFAQWCLPCQHELDSMNAQVAYLKAKYNANVIAISLDEKQNEQRVVQLIQDKAYQFPVLFDSYGDSKAVLRIQSLPYMMVLDGEGYRIYDRKGFGPASMDQLRTVLQMAQK